ncbi:MAG: hypothetical protein AAB604_02345 [Patescibacteria group bacterium]
MTEKKKQFRLTQEDWQEGILAVLAEGACQPGTLIQEAAKRAGHPRPHKSIPAARSMLTELIKKGVVEKQGKGRHVLLSLASGPGRKAKTSSAKQEMSSDRSTFVLPDNLVMSDILKLGAQLAIRLGEKMDEVLVRMRNTQESLDELMQYMKHFLQRDAELVAVRDTLRIAAGQLNGPMESADA